MTVGLMETVWYLELTESTTGVDGVAELDAG